MEDTSSGPAKLSSPLGAGALGYVLPFIVFIAFLAVNSFIPVPQALRFFTLGALLLAISRGLLPRWPSRPFSSVLLGIAVFFVWIGPDLLIPGYRHFFLFDNSLVGHPSGVTAPADKTSLLFLTFRILVSVVIVPVVEELFWRGWMMRWMIKKDFRSIPVGTWNLEAFVVVALLFASEHGSYWDVGLLTGMIYNWWAVRTRNLTDCVVAHAVTNLCLAIYVIGWNQWQYWL